MCLPQPPPASLLKQADHAHAHQTPIVHAQMLQKSRPPVANATTTCSRSCSHFISTHAHLFPSHAHLFPSHATCLFPCHAHLFPCHAQSSLSTPTLFPSHAHLFHKAHLLQKQHPLAILPGPLRCRIKLLPKLGPPASRAHLFQSRAQLFHKLGLPVP